MSRRYISRGQQLLKAASEPTEDSSSISLASLPRGGVPEAIRTRTTLLFDKIDVNSDGKLSEEEVRHAHVPWIGGVVLV